MTRMDSGLRMSRRTFLAAGGAAGVCLLGGPLSPVRAAVAQDNLVLLWNDAVLEAVRRSRLGPPMVARALAIVHTCMYDAWAAYDSMAVGTRLGGRLRRPPGERTSQNKAEAVSVAAYRAAVDLFPAASTSVFDPLMARFGYDPADASLSADRPTGVGNLAAQAVLGFRHRDGSNQLGDEPGGMPGVAYSDYTGYTPVNEPMDLRVPFDPVTVHDVNRWQPLRYIDASGALVTPRFVAPHWNRVAPFALTSGSQWRSATGPARVDEPEFAAQCQDVLDISAALTDEQKVIAEYWADGPASELPPGHWNLFAQFVSRRDGHDLDADIKLFFALTNAIFDAGIVAWDNKIAFDSVRPITAVRHHLRGQKAQAWAGPYLGTRLVACEHWLPYQPSTFPTPPFAEYSSGHSTFSAAAAEILYLFAGSQRFGASVTIPAGSSRVEPGAVPERDIALSWATFRDAADQAGMSRRYGGIHFGQGDLDGRRAGKRVAGQAWQKARSYFSGHDA